MIRRFILGLFQISLDKLKQLTYTKDVTLKHKMAQIKRERKPQIAIEKDVKDLLDRIASEQRAKKEVIADEIIVAGLKVKRLLPEDFRPAA